MQEIIKWSKDLKAGSSIALSLIAIGIFIPYILFLNLKLAGVYSLGKAGAYSKVAFLLPESQLPRKVFAYRMALREARQAQKFDSRNPLGYFAYAEILLKLAAEPKIIDYKEILNLSPEEALLAKKAGAGKENILILAKEEYEQAITRGPFNPVYYMRLGNLLGIMKDDQGAEGMFKNALYLAPKSLAYNFLLLQYYYSRGKEKESLIYLKSTADLYKKITYAPGIRKQIWFFYQKNAKLDLLK